MQAEDLVHTTLGDKHTPNKSNLVRNISATRHCDRRAVDKMMKISEEGQRETEGSGWKDGGLREMLSLLNSGGRFSCMRAIHVNIDVDVRTILLRIIYKAWGGLDLLCVNNKHLKAHAGFKLLQVCRGKTMREKVKSCNHK